MPTKKKQKDEPQLLNVKRAASFLGVSTSTIRQWALARKLKGVKLGTRGDWRFTKENLLSMISRGVSTPKHGKLGAQTNLTERKQAEEKLIESEQRFRLALAGSTQIVFSQDKNLKHTWIYNSHPDFKPEDIVGKSDNELHVPASARILTDIKQKTLNTGKAYNGEVEIELGGQVVNYAMHIEAIKDAEENVTGIIGTAIDITERIKAHQKVNESEKQKVFLLKLSDALRLLSTPQQIKIKAMRVLGEHLNASRCYYAEVLKDGKHCVIDNSFSSDLGAIDGTYRLEDFGKAKAAALQRGEVILTADVANDTSVTQEERDRNLEMQIQAYINVPLVKDSKLICLLGVNQSVVRNWTALDLTIVLETAERTWAAVERAQAEEAMRKSEEKYRTLFDTIDQGFIIVEVVQDAADKVIDFRYQEVNSAYEQQTGLRNVADKLASEITPHLESYWLEPFEHVVKTSEPTRIENYNEDTRKWYQAHYSRVGGVGSRLVGVVFDEITERKRREADLAFLADASENLLTVTNINETMRALCEKIGQHFSASAVGFSEIDEAAGTGNAMNIWNRGDLKIPTGMYRLADFHSNEVQNLMRVGKPEIVPDTSSFPKAVAKRYAALEIIAYVNIPQVRKGQWVLTLSITDNKPRDWRTDELELMSELTTRIWTRLERARAEVKLAESQEKYHSLFNSIDDAFCVFDLLYDERGQAVDYRFLEVNPAFERHTGVKNAGGKLGSELTPHTEPYWLEAYERVMQTGTPLRLENYHEGSGRWYEVFSSRIGSAGSFLLCTIFRDITERKRRDAHLAFLVDVSDDLVNLTNIDEAMNALGAKIGAHFRASICTFVEIDAERGIGTVTHDWQAKYAVSLVGVYRISDYGTEEQLATWRSGKPFVVRDAKSDERVNGEALAPYGIGSYLSIPIARDGEWRYLLSVYDRVARDWREDEIELMREITNRIWARLERAHTEEALQRAAIQKDEFIGVAAHELKTPLTSIKAYAQVLEHRFRKGGDTSSADMVKKITVQLNKLSNLIANLLDVTKIESGKLEFNMEYFDINLLVEEIVEEMQRTTDMHTFKLALQENNPVFADRDRIGQVLINLLSNAIKYSLHTNEILVSSIPEGQNIMVSVQDVGFGIPKEHQQKIFERFHRVPGRSNETYPGLGLGLYISSEIINRHNGSMWVQSEENKGSTFFVSLPQAKKE